jgi:hypothetical protein
MAPLGDKPAIEDDWQQVDDAGSVHSLPLTNDGTSDSDLVDLGERAASTATLKTKAPELISGHSQAGASKPVSQQPSNSGIQPPDVARGPLPGRTPSRSETIHRPTEKHDGAGQSNKLDEDDDVDPDHILNFAPRLANLRCRLNDVIRDTETNMENRVAHQSPLIRNIYQSLCAIQAQMNVLGQLVQDCANFYRTYDGDIDPDDLPLHGDLPSWTGQLHGFLLTFQSQVDAMISGRAHSVEVLSALEQPYETLSMLRQTMDDFLPLIRA